VREFGIPFIDAFKKGLRRFPISHPDEQWLVQCYNLMPSDEGLVSHDTIQGIGISYLFYEFLFILDQSGGLWIWTAGRDGAIEISLGTPMVENSLEPVNITPDPIPSWIELLDTNGNIWYIFPDELSGQVALSAEQPVVGVGLADFVIMGKTFQEWQYEVDPVIPTFYPKEIV
jgi:hypothetical protein